VTGSDESDVAGESALHRRPSPEETTMQQIIPNLWINDGLVEEAVDFYCSLFEDSRIVSTTDYGPEAGAYAGQKMAIYFELMGRSYVAINGADTRFEPNESVSLAVPCDTQEEIDRLWDALVEGGEPSMCGWLKDRYGFSWQVYPAVLDKMMTDADPEKVRRVTAAFMQVDRRAFRIEEIEAAFEGR
jgi:predicted 3-demethylubiquinone-9 3-methyltransferase (glyoxalase superfamily)